jgi:hypothetical protein
MAVAPVREISPSFAPSPQATQPAVRTWLREWVAPCGKIALLGLLAVGYLMLSARVLCLETQREELEKRIQAEQVRRGVLQKAYQAVCDRAVLRQYAAAAGLQQTPARVQTLTVADLPARTPSLAAHLETQVGFVGRPAATPTSAHRVIAGLEH